MVLASAVQEWLEFGQELAYFEVQVASHDMITTKNNLAAAVAAVAAEPWWHRSSWLVQGVGWEHVQLTCHQS